MRTAIASLVVTGGLLLAAPAVAVSWSPDGQSPAARIGDILLYDRPVDASALLGCEELNFVAPNFIHRRAHASDSDVSWSQLFDVWRARFGNGVPTTTTTREQPGPPAVPEPTAALVFAAGLLIASRRGR